MRIPIEDAVEYNHMQMNVEVQARTKSLHECDGAGFRPTDSFGLTARAVARKYGFDKDARDGAQHLGAKRSNTPEFKR